LSIKIEGFELNICFLVSLIVGQKNRLRKVLNMNIKRVVYFIGLLLAVMLLIAPRGWAQSKPEAKGPTIAHAFAVDKGYYGYIWKIYIEADDPNGDMLKIASVVDQPGYGRYPPDFIYLKRENQKYLKGYIQWNTYSSKTAYLGEWTEITLKVSITDKAGNESNEVIFPFTFESGVKNPYQYKLPSPFDQGDLPKLGNIHIDLFDPTLMGDGDKGE
jgi:hypothetical protein